MRISRGRGEITNSGSSLSTESPALECNDTAVQPYNTNPVSVKVSAYTYQHPFDYKSTGN